MAEEDYGFTKEEMVVSENLGYPKSYAKLCRNKDLSPFSHGPPFTFLPYALKEHEVERARDLDKMFAVIDPKAKPTTKPKIFASLLWKQLSHLGNAGFDPAVIRVDAYGNVVYYHADSTSPLAWDIDHWFPCSRGGLTVVSNLRIMQKQACKKKKNKLEFLIPWWEFQLGVSVNQFLSIFTSSNSDFRHRGFSFLFCEGEDHELNGSQIVDSHSFPQHFFALKEEIGLAPAAIVESRRESRRESYNALSSSLVDYNRNPKPMSAAIVASRKSKGNILKENEDPQLGENPYHAIVMARDSLKQREESAGSQAEIQKLDNEVKEMKLMNEEEKLIVQDLEIELIKCRRKAEKCRRLAEAQCSYRTMLEKMIRDTMHQTVMYKEQIRLNQAASTALMARLEAQKEICDAAEKELHKKFKQRDELDNEIRHEWEQGRKRTRIDASAFEDKEDDGKPVLYLHGSKPRNHLHKELRILLDEEQRGCEDGLLAKEEHEKEQKTSAENMTEEKLEEQERSLVALEEDNSIERKLERLEISESEENRKRRGKGNVEKWLEMLLEGMDPQETNENEHMTLKVSDNDAKEKQMQLAEEDRIENEASKEKINGSTRFKGVEKKEKQATLVRSESARILRRTPSSPSLFLGMRKGLESFRKKPATGNDIEDGRHSVVGNKFFSSPFKTLKKAVKL
ncbi:hypothetical protein HN51_053375 [Arachis hypogaea]|uniref:Uncharacterized protein n=2 Tax=Arachis TaxID=3817 RepID=A0A444XC75_ARAHY|nr:uncharacterized protein LOC107619420 isoform X1 [Arachis ipaensis]XP_025677787.1 uncharacterized protein LOC112777618 [Arachis hypogaea]RYQ87272.1 hypothetical protein Ahy_B09g094752 [Arachis hypogaea]